MYHTVHKKSQYIDRHSALRQSMGKLKYPTLGHQTSMYCRDPPLACVLVSINQAYVLSIISW